MIPPALTELFSTVAAGSWRAGWLILALVVVRRLVRGRIPAQVWFAVWIVVALRLLLPVSLPASWSPFNILPAHTAVSSPRFAPTSPTSTPTTLPAPAASTARAAIVTTEPESPTPVAAQDSALPVAAATASPQSASSLAAPAPSTTVQPATTRLANLLEPAAARSIYWTTTEIVTALWLAGVAILALARLIALARFHRRLRTLHATTDARLADTVAREARQLGGTGAPMCFETDAVDAPALFGILRPRLLFPPGLATQLTDDELRLVVRHELAHWRRRDLLAQTLLQAAAILHWFNPLAWFAARLARNDCELACDEFVLRRETAGGATAYGSTLLKVLGVTPRLRGRPAASVGIFESKQQLAQRVRTIAGYRAATRASLLGGIALVALLATASLTRESRGEEPVRVAQAPFTKSERSVAAAQPSIAQPLPAPSPATPISTPVTAEGPIPTTPSTATALPAPVAPTEDARQAEQAFTAAVNERKLWQSQWKIESLKAQLAELRVRYNYTATHPSVASLMARIRLEEEAIPALENAAKFSEGQELPAAVRSRARQMAREWETAETTRRLTDLQERLRAVNRQASEGEAELTTARYYRLQQQRGAKKPLEDLSFIASHPLVSRLSQELVTGRIELAALRTRFDQKNPHPDVLAATQRMEQTERELSRVVATLVAQVEEDYRMAESTWNQTRAEREDLRQQIAASETKLRELKEEAVTARTSPPLAAPAQPTADFVIRIVGAVNQQGTINFSAAEKPTVLDLIARAGGFASRADRRSIRVVSAGQDGMRTNRTLSEADVMEGFSPDARLAAGDVVVVPERPMSPGEVSVLGAVNNPGVVALPEDGKMTLATLIAKAGGPSRLGNLRLVRIVRMENGQRAVFNIDMSGMQRDDASGSAEWLTFVLKPGDTVHVPERII